MTTSLRSSLFPVLLLALAAGPAFGPAARAAEAAPGTPVNVLAIPAVTLATAQPRELIDSITVSGTLIPRDEVLVPAEVDGLRVTDLFVDEGDSVTKGQVLARLSRETLDAQLEQNTAAIRRADASIAQATNQIPQAEAAQAEAQAALSRTETLRQNGNSTQELLDQRTAAYRTAVARLAAARDGLSLAQADKASAQAQRRELMIKAARTEITSPVDGVVSRRTAKLGSVSSLVGEPMFRLIAGGQIELQAEVLETALSRLTQGAPVEVQVNGRAIEGKTRLLPAEVDKVSRIGMVRIALPQDPTLRIGSFARAKIIVARHKGVAVPTSAVSFGSSGAFVQVVKDDKVEVRPVKAGIVAEGFTEIVSGVAAGEAVVAKAGAFLRHGDTVRPLLASNTGAP